MQNLKIGDSLEKSVVVDEAKLACTVGSGSLRVYATPMAAALIESAAAELAQRNLDDEFTTVGTYLAIEHTAPTPLGGRVTARATLTKLDGRAYEFDVEACDDCGIIAKGTHKRFCVHGEKFQAKADAKLEK